MPDAKAQFVTQTTLKNPPSSNIHAVLDWYLLQRLRSPVREAFSYGTRAGIFHCAPMKYDFMLHLMTMKYVISHMRMAHGTAQSLYYLYHYTVIKSCSFIIFLTEGEG